MTTEVGVAILLLAALFLYWAAGRLQRRSGLPAARIRQSDMSGERPGPILTAEQYRLRGRPDYVLELGGRLIPVEVKPTRSARHPYDSDRMQLAAYCLLIEETSGVAPPFGILRYADQSWELPYTSETRNSLIALLHEMQASSAAHEVDRSHQQPARCRGCSQRPHCDQALTPPPPG